MEYSCFTHPTRQALSFCHSCGRYFCSDCLVESEEFYYCRDETCQNELRHEKVRIPTEPGEQTGKASFFLIKQVFKKAVLLGLICEVATTLLMVVPMLFSKWGPCGPANQWLLIPFGVGGVLNFSLAFIPLIFITNDVYSTYFAYAIVFFLHFAIWSGIWSLILIKKPKPKIHTTEFFSKEEVSEKWKGIPGMDHIKK